MHFAYWPIEYVIPKNSWNLFNFRLSKNRKGGYDYFISDCKGYKHIHHFSFVLRYCFVLRLFFFLSFFLMFSGVLSLERVDGSQPNFHTWYTGGLPQTLLKMASSLELFGSHLGKTCFHTVMTVHVLLTVLV